MTNVTKLKTGTIDWDTALTDMWDKPIPIGSEGKNLTLRFAVVEALGTGFQGDERASGEEHVNRWLLATEIKRGVDRALKADELVLIKTSVIKRWAAPFMVAQIYALIDPGERAKADARKGNPDGLTS
jgi:hypothetical protein